MTRIAGIFSGCALVARIASAGGAVAQGIPVPIGPPSFQSGSLQQPMSDGSTVNAATGAGISGSVTHGGRTTGGVSIAFSTIALGGTPTTTSAVDSKSGPAKPGDACQVASATTSALPSNVLFSCAILSAGVATITAYPLAGVAIVSPTYSVNVFWRG